MLSLKSPVDLLHEYKQLDNIWYEYLLSLVTKEAHLEVAITSVTATLGILNRLGSDRTMILKLMMMTSIPVTCYLSRDVTTRCLS